MCGITGGVCLSGSSTVDPDGLRAMRDSMSHRGPDGVGAVMFPTAGLAMRRLAIIDVESGQQPLQNEDGRIQVVCNGEIYNFRELRAALRKAGHTFRTMSDCEVIVHGYEEYGDDLLPRLNGM